MESGLPDGPAGSTGSTSSPVPVNGAASGNLSEPWRATTQLAERPGQQTATTPIPAAVDGVGFVTLKAGQIDEVFKRKKHKPSSLFYTNKRTGLCYDVRMRYHATVDEGDMHPEDPRRIYFIYRALSESGLVDDEDVDGPKAATILAKFKAREVTKAEACLVHSEAHWDFIQSTASE